jgi:hypothetical protein
MISQSVSSPQPYIVVCMQPPAEVRSHANIRMFLHQQQEIGMFFLHF